MAFNSTMITTSTVRHHRKKRSVGRARRPLHMTRRKFHGNRLSLCGFHKLLHNSCCAHNLITKISARTYMKDIISNNSRVSSKSCRRVLCWAINLLVSLWYAFHEKIKKHTYKYNLPGTVNQRHKKPIYLFFRPNAVLMVRYLQKTFELCWLKQLMLA